jgi:hypothetical protein
LPVTPFHLIAVTPVKAALPKHFSWSIFALTNILIDLEPITLFIVTLNPQHLFFHTILGATLIAALSATIGKQWCKAAIDIWNEEINNKKEDKLFRADNRISSFSAWFSALLGAWSHLLLDSFMHDDIKPLSPFTDANVLFGTISIGWLHTICVFLGLLGAFALILKRK